MLLTKMLDFPRDVRAEFFELRRSFDMLMIGVEDIRGRLGVAYRALGCSLLSCRLFHSFTLHSFLSSVYMPLSLSLTVCVRTEMPDYQLSRTSGINRARNPFTLPAYKIVDRAPSTSRERERYAIAKKRKMCVCVCVCV